LETATLRQNTSSISGWEGSWLNTPDSRKGPIVESVVNVRRWGPRALFSEPMVLDAFASHLIHAGALPAQARFSRIGTLRVERVLSLPNVAVVKVEVTELYGTHHPRKSQSMRESAPDGSYAGFNPLVIWTT
jgi:hypothetical protein